MSHSPKVLSSESPDDLPPTEAPISSIANSSVRRLVTSSPAASPLPVTNNPTARLMHYVRCVCDAIDVHPEATSFVTRMRDYAQADALERDDQLALVRRWLKCPLWRDIKQLLIGVACIAYWMMVLMNAICVCIWELYCTYRLSCARNCRRHSWKGSASNDAAN